MLPVLAGHPQVTARGGRCPQGRAWPLPPADGPATVVLGGTVPP
jgi:hypothetical protein